MIDRLIRSSFAKPALTLILVLAGTAFGTRALQDLRRDVFPDLSAPVFNVIVQNAAMGAEELETGISIPLEASLAGLPDVRRIRSASQLGVCQVTIEFEPDADYYRLLIERGLSRRVTGRVDSLPAWAIVASVGGDSVGLRPPTNLGRICRRRSVTA